MTYYVKYNKTPYTSGYLTLTGNLQFWLFKAPFTRQRFRSKSVSFCIRLLLAFKHGNDENANANGN